MQNEENTRCRHIREEHSENDYYNNYDCKPWCSYIQCHGAYADVKGSTQITQLSESRGHGERRGCFDVT